VTSELYDAISAVAPAYDAKLPDSYALTDPVIVVLAISDVPTVTIDAAIVLRDQRITCEVHALTIQAARVTKEALITALHGWRGGAVKACAFESGGPELYDADLVPPRYVLPVDFMLTF
jgi:hypothetical protein